MWTIILETLDRRLELNAIFSRHPVPDEGTHDDSSSIELIRVPIKTLILIRDLNIPQVV